MNNKNKKIRDNNRYKKIYNITLESKLIKQSNSKIVNNAIDNSKIYYSERFGWTLKKINTLKV